VRQRDEAASQLEAEGKLQQAEALYRTNNILVRQVRASQYYTPPLSGSSLGGARVEHPGKLNSIGTRVNGARYYEVSILTPGHVCSVVALPASSLQPHNNSLKGSPA